MQEFFTRELANEGVKLPLFHPDGSPSEHWITVRGIDSDHFRKKEAESKRDAINLALVTDLDERAKAVRLAQHKCIASLVAGWSFEKEATETNVVSFFEEAPQIADMVNRYASHRASFFSKKSEPSVTGQSRK